MTIETPPLHKSVSSRRRLVFLAALAWVLSIGWSAPQASPQAGAPAATPAATVDQRAVVDKYCLSCHNTRTNSAGLSLERTSVAGIESHPDVWEKVIRKVRAGMMPPPGMPAPDAESRRALVGWLETVARSMRPARRPTRDARSRIA